MEVMETTTNKVKRFSYFLETHYRTSDAIIDPIMDKLFDRERQSLLKQRDRLRTDLDQFEHQYALESSEFHEKFENGEIGDDMDFFDWSATWDIYQAILKSLGTFESTIVLS